MHTYRVSQCHYLVRQQQRIQVSQEKRVTETEYSARSGVSSTEYSEMRVQGKKGGLVEY